MTNFDIAIKTTDGVSIPELDELAVITIKLRYYTEYWHDHHGAWAKNRMDYWKKRADDWIDAHVRPFDKQSIIDKQTGF